MIRPETFDELVVLVRRFLWRTVHRLYHPRLRMHGVMRDDLYGAALVALWEAWRKYDPTRGEFGPWVFWLVPARVREWLRSVRRGERWREGRERVPLKNVLAEDPASVEVDTVEMPDRLAAVLPELTREAIRLRFFSPSGCSTHTEHARASYGVRQLGAMGRDRVEHLLGIG